MRITTRIISGAALLLWGGMLYAQSPAANSGKTQPAISFHFERKGLPVPEFTIQIHEDGSGTYQAAVVESSLSEDSTQVSPPQHVERTMTVTPATVAMIFKAAHELKNFDVACASKAKNIADTGTKTLTYAGPDGAGSCVYNYSQNKNVATLTDTFQGIAYTMDEGRRLEFLHRYDRLGLDAEMSRFAEEAQAGRALELSMIEPTLTAIVRDMALIQRVRLQAAKMLAQAKDNS
jgi:hypothetical protein